MNEWDGALNLVDAKIQEFRHAPFEQLAKRPYSSELPESNDAVRYTLFVDPIATARIRVILQAQSTDDDGQPRTFAHGFDMQRDGTLSDVPADVLWAFS